MQKHYRDFTVGEILDMGLRVEVSTHDITSEDECKKITRKFEGTKQSTQQINKDLKTFRAWKKNFEVVCYL
jgi:hypothetical protein